MQEQSSRLEELRGSHDALKIAMEALRTCHKTSSSASRDHVTAPLATATAGLQQHGDVKKLPSEWQEGVKPLTSSSSYKKDSAFGVGALQVVTAAHSKGFALSDLESFGDDDWAALGATSSERQSILAALESRRTTMTGNAHEGDSVQVVPAAGWTRKTGASCRSLSVGALETKPTCAMDHILYGTAIGDGVGAHGHSRPDDIQGGLARYVGHGKQHFNIKDHIYNGIAVEEDPGLHGHAKDSDVERGLLRGIGHGRHHIETVDHIYGGTPLDLRTGRESGQENILGGNWKQNTGDNRRYIGGIDHIKGGAAADNIPGAHGHLKDDALQGGLSRGIGHGKKHIEVQDHLRGCSAGLLPHYKDSSGSQHHSSPVFDRNVSSKDSSQAAGLSSLGATPSKNTCTNAYRRACW